MLSHGFLPWLGGFLDQPIAIEFTYDLSQAGEAFEHFWEHTVGSGHATLALRADWQRQLSRCRKDLGFKHVRFHGLLSDDMGTLVDEDEKLVDSFFNADQIFDFLLSIGMRPFVELSFMPSTLSSGDTTVFHYKSNVTPPRDFAQWGAFIGRLVQHWCERYGVDEVSEWFFEVWNEPNLPSFWTGSQADYFKLYNVTARAIKKVSGSLKVGGPATASNAWIPEFLDYCDKEDLPADFISTHHYPTDAFGEPGDDTLTQLADSRRGVLRDEALKSKTQAQGKPLYYTEWSTSSNPFDSLHDQSYAAAAIAKTVMDNRGIVQGYSYWTFSDIFEENYFSSVPFHGGFGLMTIHGVPKPAYRAFQILHSLGDQILKVEGGAKTVDVWATREPKFVKVLIVNSALPRHEIKTEYVSINLKGVSEFKSAFIERIDETSANPQALWQKMGSPQYLTSLQVQALETSSLVSREPIDVSRSKDAVQFVLTIPPQAIACVSLELA